MLLKAARTDELATTGLYPRVRHPQYVGFLVIMVGFLLQWPTIPTLVLTAQASGHSGARALMSAGRWRERWACRPWRSPVSSPRTDRRDPLTPLRRSRRASLRQEQPPKRPGRDLPQRRARGAHKGGTPVRWSQRAASKPPGGLAIYPLWVKNEIINQPASPTPHRGYTDDKDAVLKRLRRIEGQVRGLQRMVGDDANCIDVLTQVSAVTKGLQAVALELLDAHPQTLRHRGGPSRRREADQKLAEAAGAISRLVSRKGSTAMKHRPSSVAHHEPHF